MSLTDFALIVVSVLALLDLLLSVGYIRRLRDLDHVLRDRSSLLNRTTMIGGLAVGTPVPSFTATALTGTVVTPDTFAGTNWLLGFFGATCGSCRSYLPVMQQLIDNGAPALVVIDGSRDHAADLLKMVRPEVPTVIDVSSDISQAFKLEVYPTFYLVDEIGDIAFASNSVDELRQRLGQS